MSENHDFNFKLAVWDRIEKGTATQEDHNLAFKWGEEHLAGSRKRATPLDKWMTQRGEEILEAWPFPVSSSRSDFPREQIILFAIMYGYSDIANGGLEQFFGNNTGGFAPETTEGLELIGAAPASRILRQAMSLFGTPYPREQSTRVEMLPSLTARLFTLSDLFFESFPSDEQFASACEELLANSMK
ncbi:MAG: DUF4375 domain-containing protein [Pirellula sp.]|jgi:hypothetical protein